MDKWEYRHQYIALVGENLDSILPVSERMDTEKNYVWERSIEKELQKYGNDGWELVYIEPRLINGDGLDGYALFKRKSDK